MGFRGERKTVNDPFAHEDVPRRGFWFWLDVKRKEKKKKGKREKKKERKGKKTREKWHTL